MKFKHCLKYIFVYILYNTIYFLAEYILNTFTLLCFTYHTIILTTSTL